MQIVRDKIRETFQNYVEAYDDSQDKIRLKIGHTYKVADNSDRICESLNMSEEEKDIAWLIAMLHDIGRFEQLRRFNTFVDSESIDHARFGADLLFREENPLIRGFITDETEDSVIETAVRWHSAFAIPEDLDERTARFCNIIRDADKIDIYRVNIQYPMESIYNTDTETLHKSQINEEAFQASLEHNTILRELRRQPIDHVVGHISLIYGMVYPESLRLVEEQGYMAQLMQFQSWDQETQKRYEEVCSEALKWIEERKKK